MTALTMTRKADREAAAQVLRDIAAKFGATVEEFSHDRDITITIRLGQVLVMSHLDAQLPDIHLGHWVSRDRKFRFLPIFASVNQYHGCKATTDAPSFNVLAAMIQNGLRAHRDGRMLHDEVQS